MRSGTSSFERGGWFNLTLLKKNLTRFWPLWVLYTGTLFLSLGMPIINLKSVVVPKDAITGQTFLNGAVNTLGEALRPALQAYMVEQYRDVIHTAMGVAVLLGAVYGCLLAMAFFSYLMNRRSVGMIHALPIKREGLFFTNWLSGLLFVVGPSLLIFLVALLAEAGKGAVGLEELLLWLLVNASVTLFFFDFAVCCAMFTGQLLALPVFYLILNGLVAGMYFLFGMALEVLFIGYGGGRVSAWQPVLEWFTPVIYLTERVTTWDVVELPDGSVRDSLMSGALEGSAYAILAGAALLLIAFWVYRARQMERAEDLVTVSWVRPIFRYGVGVCTGFALGTLLYEYFIHGGVVGYIVLVTLCAVVGGFAGQMFLRKTLRVLRSGWKGSLTLGVCMLLFLCGIRMDVGGFQSRVPQVEEVEEVYLSGVRSEPSDDASWTSVILEDPKLIGQVVQLHRSLVGDMDKLEQADRGAWEYGYDDRSLDLRLSYTMKDGSELERRYDTIPISRADLDDPDSFASRLLALLETPEVLWKNYLFGRWTENPGTLSAVGGSISNYSTGENLLLEYEEAQALWRAIQEDINAGRYHRHLFYEEAGISTREVRISLDLYGFRTDSETGEEVSSSASMSIMLQVTASSTMEVMEKLGYLKAGE